MLCVRPGNRNSGTIQTLAAGSAVLLQILQSGKLGSLILFANSDTTLKCQNPNPPLILKDSDEYI